MTEEQPYQSQYLVPPQQTNGTSAYSSQTQPSQVQLNQTQPNQTQSQTQSFVDAPAAQVSSTQAMPSAQSSAAYGASAQTKQQTYGSHMAASPLGAHAATQMASTSDGYTSNASKKSSGGAKTFLLAFVGAAVACVLVLGGYTLLGGTSSSSTQLGSSSSTEITAENNEEDQSLAEAVAQKALPSVAAIDVYSASSSQGYYGTESSSDTLTQSSLGSGVVLSEDGYIVTNYHVIEGSDALKVTVNGTEYDAEVVGTDSSSDIAVIKAQDASGLTAIELGDSDNLTVGEWVMSIGSPFGLEQSVATGIVSATSRSQIMQDTSSSDPYGLSQGSTTTMVYANLIQTDAAINPGNSGGALVDADGKLIGINTLITSYSGNYSGVGFAIPVNYAVNIAQQIINGETPTHAQLGVSLSTITSSIAERYGFSVSEGAYIASVSAGSGAEEAGIQKGDIVTKFDGKEVTSASDLMVDVRGKNPGDTVTLEVNRNGETLEIEVTLGDDSSSESTTQQQSYSSILENMLGGSSSSGQAS